MTADQPNIDVSSRPDERIILTARNIERRARPDGKLLLRCPLLTLARHEKLLISGPSGSGKTVLLRALALLDPLDSGEILLQGVPVAGAALPAYRARVIYLHQRAPLTDGTVLDNLRLPFTLHVHRRRQFDTAAITRWLGQLGWNKSFLNQSVRNLSGGEQQIVALLRAIQLSPQVLLLDEPTAALDDHATRAFERLVLDWCDQQPDQRALVLVTHDVQQVDRLASRTLYMANGRPSPTAPPTANPSV